MIFSCSRIEPGQPCVTISGSAFGMLRTHMQEVNVDPIDVGDELRQGVQLRLARAPVVLGRPVAREVLNRRELHALVVSVTLSRWPPRRGNAPVEVRQRLFRYGHPEGTDGSAVVFGYRSRRLCRR